MSYPNFGKVKTIVLPIDYDFISNNDGENFSDVNILYKERYGIDLENLIELNDDSKVIRLKGDAFYLLTRTKLDTANSQKFFNKGILISYIPHINDEGYASGSNPATLNIILRDDNLGEYYGFVLTIPSNVDFLRENIVFNIVEA